MSELLFRRDRSWQEDYSTEAALRLTLQDYDDPENAWAAVASMLAVMLDGQPPEKVLRVLNAGSKREWGLIAASKKPEEEK